MTSTTSRFAYHGGTEAVTAPEEIRMSEQAFQPLLYAISADVVKRLVAGGMSLGAALGAFYSSHLYAALSDSATGLWRAPTRSLVAFFDEERRTGHLPVDWGE